MSVSISQVGTCRAICKSGRTVQQVPEQDWFPLSRGWGHPILHVTNRIGYSFNFAEKSNRSARVETEEKADTKLRTSYTEYEVDALALEAEEGRGDRRNVQGELHTSYEP